MSAIPPPPSGSVDPPKSGGLKGFIVNHKVWSAVIGLLLLSAVGAALSPPEAADPVASSATAPATEAPDTEAPVTEAPATEAPAATEPPEPKFTVSQENAIETAESYLDSSSFSEQGLIEQLEFEGYPAADAKFAVKHISVNWNEQAAKSAKEYLDYSSFSREGLIEQLEFEGFTTHQAIYGVDKTGL